MVVEVGIAAAASVRRHLGRHERERAAELCERRAALLPGRAQPKVDETKPNACIGDGGALRRLERPAEVWT